MYASLSLLLKPKIYAIFMHCMYVCMYVLIMTLSICIVLLLFVLYYLNTLHHSDFSVKSSLLDNRVAVTEL